MTQHDTATSRTFLKVTLQLPPDYHAIASAMPRHK